MSTFNSNTKPAQPPSNSMNKILNSKFSNAEMSKAVNQDGAPARSQEPSMFDRVSSMINNTADYIKTIGKTEEAKPSASNANTTATVATATTSFAFVSENYTIILGLFIAFVALVLLFFFSKSFNVSRVVGKMNLYNNYLKIVNYDYSSNKGVTLNSVAVASAYNACHMGAQMFSYTSEDILRQVLRAGARYIEFTIFCDKYGTDAIPIIDSGYAKGEWKLMLNTTTFESGLKALMENAFKQLEPNGGAPNPEDPIFLGLNLCTGNNIYCMDRMADLLIQYVGDKLLGPQYAYQFNKDIHTVKISDIASKVIIFASPGFEGSKLEELVNSSWELLVTQPEATTEGFASDATATTTPELKKIKKALNNAKPNRLKVNSPIYDKAVRLEEALKKEFGEALTAKAMASEKGGNSDVNGKSKNDGTAATTNNKEEEAPEAYEDVEPPSLEPAKPRILRIPAALFDEPNFDGGFLREHNKTGLTIVVPHLEGDYITRNYNPTAAWELGCQFVAMNYQEIDEHMDVYITRFEQGGILNIE